MSERMTTWVDVALFNGLVDARDRGLVAPGPEVSINAHRDEWLHQAASILADAVWDAEP